MSTQSIPAHERQEWADKHIADLAGGLSIPRYGSVAWAALDDTDPLKVAAALRAAELWARDGDDIAEALTYLPLDEVGEPLVDDPRWRAMAQGIARSIDRMATAYEARAAAGSSRAAEQLAKMNDKSWLREPSVYEQVIAEGGLGGFEGGTLGDLVEYVGTASPEQLLIDETDQVLIDAEIERDYP